ncbi:MAG TPA: hypothetical protein PL158_02770, partial [Bacillota bacterium]|nr:hypothetical protein [Bacillota bacterium]
MSINSQKYKISPLLLNEEITKNPQKVNRLLLEISPHYHDKLEQVLSKYRGKMFLASINSSSAELNFLSTPVP